MSCLRLNRLFCVQIFTHLCNDTTFVWRHAFYALFLASLCVCAYFVFVWFPFLSYFFHFAVYGLQFFAKAGIINGDIVAFVPLSSTKRTSHTPPTQIRKRAYTMCQSCLHTAMGARDTVRRAREDTSSTSCNEKKSQIKGVVLF